MKDIVTPVPPEEVRQVIKKCLENAALVNYTRISEYAKIEGMTPLTPIMFFFCKLSGDMNFLSMNTQELIPIYFQQTFLRMNYIPRADWLLSLYFVNFHIHIGFNFFPHAWLDISQRNESLHMAVRE